MAVQFVIGRAGSGKTRHCLDAITRALGEDPLGPAIYWIVPRQATFTAERALLSASPAFGRVRVLSFEQLGREIFACAGGNVIPEVTPLGRQMVIGHLLRRLKPQLGFFAGSARQPGLAAELDAAFAEFERAGKTPAELGTLLGELQSAKPADVDHVSLLAKLRDLRLVYDAYTRFLGQERLDPHQRLQQVLRCIDACPPLRGATMYVDEFTEFTDFERRLLAGVAQVCARLEITLLLDPASPLLADPHHFPDDDALFHQTEQTYRRLWFTFHEAGVPVEAPFRLTESHRFADLALKTLEGWHVSDSLPVESSAVRFVVAPHREAEVDAVSREIRKLWREGVRLREIAVLVRDLGPYHASIDASFREHGIAYFIDHRRSAGHHPLLQFVRSFFQIIRFDWLNDAVIALMKSGLAGVTPAEADEVENYVAQHRIRGSAWARAEPWAYRRRLTRSDEDAAKAEQPEAVDAIRRRVVDLLRPAVSLLRPGDTLSVREIATELFATLDRFGIRDTLAAWSQASATSDPEQAAEHEQVWAEFIDLCDQMVDLLGEESVALVDFVDVLESGLEQFDLALTPPTVDQVLVGQIDRTRCPELKAAFVLGVNDGEFPRVAREPSVLTEPERREMRRRHIELDADRRRQLRDEDLLGYVAFTRASERLVVSRTRADNAGRELQPSRFWHRLQATFPDVTPVEIPRETRNDARFLETPRQVLVALMRWARSQDSADALAATGTTDDSPWPALYQWLATESRDGDAIGRMRRLAWRAIGYTNDAALSADLAAGLFPTPLEATPRQLETFAACPFKHFAQHGLGISGQEPPGVTGLDLSRVYHRVLDIVVAEALEKRTDWQRLGEVVSPDMIHDYAQAVGQTLRGELMLGTARNKYLLGRIERTLAEVVAAQAEMLRRGQFRPTFTSVMFGEKGRLPALRVTTPGRQEALVRGSIDRIDLLPGEQHVAAFDYKLSAGPLAMQDVYYGLSLQLLTHLLVLQASGQELVGRPLTPVAAFYLPLIRRLRDVPHPDEALDPADPRFNLRVKPRGVFDAEFLPAFDEGLERGWSDVVAAFVNKDGALGHRGNSDAADTGEFAALLTFVHRRLGELADGIVAGRVEVTPYRMGRVTPCPRCEYRSVCRFEPSINRYTNLQPLRREAALERMSEGAADAE